MTTVRQIERLWDAGRYQALVELLMQGRVENSRRLVAEASRAVPAAALALIRLDELSQAHRPVCQRLIHMLLNSQDADGGWGEPLTTALCLRALRCGNGHGTAITAGMRCLTAMQKENGSWPSTEIRRLDGDAYVTAFILFQLGEQADFRATVRLDDALRWCEAHEQAMERYTRQLWLRARERCRSRLAITPGEVLCA